MIIYQKIVKKTSEIVSKWKDFIKQEELQKSYKIMLDWQVELTNSLWHWVPLGDGISIGDLILARINIGMLVETLKLVKINNDQHNIHCLVQLNCLFLYFLILSYL